MKKNKSQQTNKTNEQENLENKREFLQWYQSGRTVRNVDFQRIENNLWNGVPLSPYEFEVKEKLASSPSPFDLLAQAEEEEEKKQRNHELKTKMRILVSRVRFSPLQRECFELFYEKHYSAKTVQKRLNISASHFCHLKERIIEKLIETHAKSSQLIAMKRKKGSSPLTPRQKAILKLRDQGMTLHTISQQFGISTVRVHQIIKESSEKLI